MQVELHWQQLQSIEARNDELTVLASALESEKGRLEQQPLANAILRTVGICDHTLPSSSTQYLLLPNVAYRASS